MALGENGQPQAEIERPSRGRDAKGNLGRFRFQDVWRTADPAEARERRRARRVALLLMALSSAASLLILYGGWIALR